MKSLISAVGILFIVSGASVVSAEYYENRNSEPERNEFRNNTSNYRRDQKPLTFHYNYFDNQVPSLDKDISDPQYDRFLPRSRNNFRNSYYDNYHNIRYLNDGEGNRQSVYRTYGRGRAQVTRQGETVNVPNEMARKSVYRGHSSARMQDDNDGRPNGHRSRCRECPRDQTVVATKGNSFVILPEPCSSNPRMWTHHSGPRPGTKLREGVHVIRGTLGPKKKYCEYQYQVLVRRCEPLKPQEEDTNVECTDDNVWGSQCNITCGYEKDPLGETSLECLEDLTWSHSMPKCKSKLDCSTPKVKTNSKIWCQTANMTYVEGDFIPNGSTCRFNKNGRDVSINCKQGTWRISRKTKGSHLKKKYKFKQEPEIEKPKEEKNDTACNPNPCQNGGTCYRSEKNKESPICVCRHQTRGTFCEMRECDYNICYNGGMCIFQGNERTCYCLPEFQGDQCQLNKDY